jgi:Transposase DDE domain
MTRPFQLYAWANTVARHLPQLSKPVAFVLALWSFGMVLAHTVGLDSVALVLAPLLGRSDNTVRQRLREFYQPRQRKAGTCRRDLDPTTCFVPLLRWVTDGWTTGRLVLALDVTNLGSRFQVLAISVVVRGCGIPVAWTIRTGNQPGAWNPLWDALLDRLRAAVPTDWQVLVLTDRGLESAQLFRSITACGWHPLMRVKGGGSFRPTGWHRFYPLKTFAAHVGAERRVVGQAYATAALPCTLLAAWTTGHAEAWLLLTDLAPAQANPCWYAYRAWIEQNFKVLKRAGWQWQRTRMTDAARAERLWLALAVATWWLVSVGSVAEETVPVETLPGLRSEESRPQIPRRHRVFRRGLARLMVALVWGISLPCGRIVPEDWPAPNQEVPTITEQEFTSS